jgi:twitching motility protein PilT
VIKLSQILAFAVRHGVSDIHLRPGKTPFFRRDGELVTQQNAPEVTEGELTSWFASMAGERHVAQFQRDKEVDFATTVEEVGRFRVSAFQQRDQLALALRHIPVAVRSVKELGLPKKLEEIALSPRGLILVTGATGSGKSTTLAAMVQTINRSRPCHILTIEDPIEYVYPDHRAIVSQRQIGTDTMTFASALRSAVRQDPDVILLGELRDRETAETALHAAETGHLVLSTLHTVNAMETIQRLVSLFPPHQHDLVRSQLSSVLKAVVSQRLVRAKKGGRIPACEVLIQTELVRELVGDPERLFELEDAMENGRNTYGMQTFDQALLDLVRSGTIHQEEALKNASRRASLQLALDGFA